MICSNYGFFSAGRLPVDFRTAGGLPAESSALKKFLIRSWCSSASFLYKVDGKLYFLEIDVIISREKRDPV